LTVLFFSSFNLFAIAHKTIPASKVRLAFVEFIANKENGNFIVNENDIAVKNAEIKALEIMRKHPCIKRAIDKGLKFYVKMETISNVDGQTFIEITTRHC